LLKKRENKIRKEGEKKRERRKEVGTVMGGGGAT